MRFPFQKRNKREKKKTIFSRLYRTYINLIYVIMYFGSKRTILPEFRPTPTAEKCYIAGLNKLGYIRVEVIDGDQRYQKHFESYMLD